MFIYFRNPPAPADNVSNFFHGFRLGGHRGSPLNAPENTMVSFKQALREGVDLVEFDIGLTRDGVPVLMHDDTLDRTTNMSGLLRDHDFSELAAECNCAASFRRPRGVDLPDEPQPDGRVPICTLEDVVQWAKEKNVKMLFDVKDSDTELVDKIGEVFEQYDLFDCALVCSFYPWVIYRIKRQNNRILTGVTWRRR
uniref:GP-PDE domain-containing protein n=1 Tax=Globodera rostochiensis TaxID=31243 RepID=A0A914HY49_GLORO